MTLFDSMRRAVLHLFAAVLLMRTLVGLASESNHELFGHDGQTNHFARAPYLQLATPNSIVIAWRTDGENEPIVRYGRSVETLDQQVPASSIVTRVALTTNKAELKIMEEKRPELLRLPKLHSAPMGLFQYEVRITGLNPDTRYYYAVYDGKRRLTDPDQTYHFTTHPPNGEARPARFWVVGDSGVGREAQHNVHLSTLDWVKQEGRPLDFYVHLGDMAYLRGRDVEFQTRFFEMYEPTLRNLVCWPTLGKIGRAHV